MSRHSSRGKPSMCDGQSMTDSFPFLVSVGLWYTFWSLYGHCWALVQEGAFVCTVYTLRVYLTYQRLGLALSINALGSSLGGTLIPIATRRLIVEVGYVFASFMYCIPILYFNFDSFAWTMRILGFLVLFALTLPNLILARRLPPKRSAGGLFNPAAFKSPAFSVYCASGLITFLGIYTGAFLNFAIQT